MILWAIVFVLVVALLSDLFWLKAASFAFNHLSNVEHLFVLSSKLSDCAAATAFAFISSLSPLDVSCAWTSKEMYGFLIVVML